jgi:hypothetical protein
LSLTPEQKKARRNARLRANRASRREEILGIERARRRALKLKMIELCSGGAGCCVRCGVTPGELCLEAFEFHHPDRTRKRFNVCGSHTRSWAVLAEEMAVTSVMCSNCHRQRESEIRSESQGMGDGRPTKASMEPPPKGIGPYQWHRDEGTRRIWRASRAEPQG